MANKSLEERFIAFAKSLDGAECIDDLPLTAEQSAAQKGDFFFNGRTIVSEIKSLKTNTQDKIDVILNPYEETAEWPVFYGEQEVHKILDFLPNRDELRAKIFNSVTDSIEGIIEKANRQIRETKRTFDLPSAGGLLIILNDLVDVFAPGVLARRVTRCLRKRTASGQIRFPEITLVWALNAAHYAQLTPTLKGMPILVMPSGLPDPNHIEKFVGPFGRKWAECDGKPYLKTTADILKRHEFKKFSDDAKKQKPMPRHEVWRLRYRENPYLRTLTKEALLEHGQSVLAKTGRMISVKAKRRPPRELMDALGAQFTHFIEEMNFRAIDMREFAPKVEGLNERFHVLSSKRKQSKTDKNKEYKNKIGRGARCPCQSGKTYSKCCGRRRT